MHSVILYFLTVLLSCQVLIKWKTIKASIEICPFSFKWDESTTISWIFSGISRVYLQKFWDPPCILPPAFSFGWTKLFFWFRYPFNRQQYCLAKCYRWDRFFFQWFLCQVFICPHCPGAMLFWSENLIHPSRTCHLCFEICQVHFQLVEYRW